MVKSLNAAIAVLMLWMAVPGLAQVPPEVPPVKQLRVDDTVLSYVEDGTGPPVVFVHGAGIDLRAWEPLRPFIARQFRFVSVSRRYHYPNEWTDDGGRYTFDRQVEDIAGFIRALNVGKVHLVGNSYGGRLAGVLALRYPELLRSVVLGEPSLVVPKSPEGQAAVAAYVKDLGSAGAAAKAGDDHRAAELLIAAVLDDPKGFAGLSLAQQRSLRDNEKTMGAMFKGPPATPVTCEQMSRLQVPALVVRGENTRAAFKYAHDELLSCLPADREAAVISGARHTWPTDNASAAAAAILAFLAKH